MTTTTLYGHSAETANLGLARYLSVRANIEAAEATAAAHRLPGAQPAGVNEAREAGLQVLASDDRLTAVYFTLSFGDVVVVRSGAVYLAAEYDAGVVGR